MTRRGLLRAGLLAALALPFAGLIAKAAKPQPWRRRYTLPFKRMAKGVTVAELHARFRADTLPDNPEIVQRVWIDDVLVYDRDNPEPNKHVHVHFRGPIPHA